MRRLLGLPGWLARPIARVLVLALSVTSLAPILHDLDDAACEPALVRHDASQHRFSAAPTGPDRSGAPDHCLACHLQRASRGPAVLKSSAPPVLAAATIRRPIDRVFVTDSAALPLPARAPPVLA